MLDETRENFRNVADFLSHQAREQSVRSVVFTGVSPGCGTTTTAWSVARELAHLAGLRTLLVDLNCRRPGVARMFAKEASGTIEFWSTTADDEREIKGTPVPSVPGLAVVVPPPNASVTAETVRRVIQKAAHHFDMVLFDTPPVLGYADAFVVAGVTQGMVLVVEAGQTPFEVIDRVKHEIGVRGVTLLGSVLNKHRRFIPGWVYRLFAR
jgi:succinoglycan biosynthesis transport protein ExoP